MGYYDHTVSIPLDFEEWHVLRYLDRTAIGRLLNEILCCEHVSLFLVYDMFRCCFVIPIIFIVSIFVFNKLYL